MKKQLHTSIGLIIGIVIMLNLLSTEFHFRLDLTEGGQYTLSKATRDILNTLDEPVTVKAYFSKNLPPDVEKARKDFQDMLVEYAGKAHGMIQYSFINPDASDADEQAAEEKGIRPVLINVREKDQVKQQKALLGAIVTLGEKQVVIPLIQPGAAMEYDLSTAIKKLAVSHKPTIGFITGQGEAPLDQMSQLDQQLQILYQARPVPLTDSTVIPPDIHTLALIRPADSLRPTVLPQLDSFLARGGRLVIALSHVQGSLQTGQARLVNTGLEGWLARKGLVIENNCIIDAQCGSVPIQQRAGFFSLQSDVALPYLPMITNLAHHPVTTGLENVLLEFPSSIRYTGPAGHYTPLAFSSSISDTVSVPLLIDVNKQWKQGDFHSRNLPVAALLDGDIEAKGRPSALIVITDGNFVVNGPQQQGARQLPPDNINFLSNAIDWLTDNTGLIGLRTKAVTSRPLHELSDSTKAMLKYLNFLLPVLLAIGYGLFRARKNQAIRQQRMIENDETAE